MDIRKFLKFRAPNYNRSQDRMSKGASDAPKSLFAYIPNIRW